MRFLGLDLAFVSTNPTGLCILDDRGQYVGSDYLSSDEDMASAIARHVQRDGNVIVVDGPLVCTNASGQRSCETEVGRRYGGSGASCHSSNTGKPAGRRGPRFLEVLKAHCPPTACRVDAQQTSEGLWPVIETYPHPAHLELFQLRRIIKYKKGTAGEKQRGLRKYMGKLHELARSTPSLQVGSVPFLQQDIMALKGRARKRHEDLLDALFCAYTGLYLWYYRDDPNRWHVFGNADSGFITIPTV